MDALVRPVGDVEVLEAQAVVLVVLAAESRHVHSGDGLTRGRAENTIYERGCPAAFLISSSTTLRKLSGTAAASSWNIGGSAERYVPSS